MQFSDYSHPEWCEEQKFTKVEITGEKQSALTVDAATHKIIVDGSKEVNQEQFVAFCDYFSNNKEAISKSNWFDQALGLMFDGVMTEVSVIGSGVVFTINIDATKSMILFTTMIVKDTSTAYVFAIFNEAQTFKNLTAPAYTWVKLKLTNMENIPTINMSELSEQLQKEFVETEVELIDYKLTIDISQNVKSYREVDPELALELETLSGPLPELLFSGLNVYGIIGGEVKEPVFNFTTNCNLFINNMR